MRLGYRERRWRFISLKVYELWDWEMGKKETICKIKMFGNKPIQTHLWKRISGFI